LRPLGNSYIVGLLQTAAVVEPPPPLTDGMLTDKSEKGPFESAFDCYNFCTFGAGKGFLDLKGK
jgi:hypothetical protein